jgi:ABC-type multidrug transport system ATPase subunit
MRGCRLVIGVENPVTFYSPGTTAEFLKLVGLFDEADRPIKGFSGGER